MLDVLYDYKRAGQLLRAGGRDAARRDLFRFLPVLPVAGPGPVMPAGATPLVQAPRLAARLGLRALYLKDESRNPTGVLKDRATAIAVSMAAAMGRRDLYCASAGNAAISLAGFCAHAGFACHVFVPATAGPEQLAWLRRYTADVRVVDGSYDDAYDEAERVGLDRAWYSRNCAFNPYLVEGKKTAALEIAEQLGWSVPDVVAAPVGDGCTLGAIGKGFRELVEMGITARTPRLVGAQAAAVQPLVTRHLGQRPAPPSSKQTTGAQTTRAHSIAVRRPRNALRVLAEVAASEGTLVAVADDRIAEAQVLLEREGGIAAELASAASLAALLGPAAEMLPEGGTAVIVVTAGRRT